METCLHPMDKSLTPRATFDFIKLSLTRSKTYILLSFPYLNRGNKRVLKLNSAVWDRKYSKKYIMRIVWRRTISMKKDSRDVLHLIQPQLAINMNLERIRTFLKSVVLVVFFLLDRNFTTLIDLLNDLGVCFAHQHMMSITTGAIVFSIQVQKSNIRLVS